MINKHIFCARKGGATMETKFYPLSTSGILAKQIERASIKLTARAVKRGKKAP